MVKTSWTMSNTLEHWFVIAIVQSPEPNIPIVQTVQPRFPLTLNRWANAFFQACRLESGREKNRNESSVQYIYFKERQSIQYIQ